MKPKFKNITEANELIYNQFLEFHNKKFNFRYMLYTVCMFLFILYMIIFNIIYNNLKFIVIIILMGLISLLVYKIYLKGKVVDRELKSSKIRNKEEILYKFYDRFFVVIKNNVKQKMRYSKLYKIHQDKFNFYLYIDETHAFIMSKSGFIEGNLKDFKMFISKKCRFKYKKQI